MNKQSNTEFDVIIVGAGISGLGSAYHLQDQCPDKSFCVLEGLESFGGTWLTHKYPGIRSDSDMFTFGYRFKPWTDKPIASGEAILDYLGEVIEENNLSDKIRYNKHIESADWNEQTQKWTLTVIDKQTNTVEQYECNFLWMCQGYYQHEQGYMPTWKGTENYQGQLVHPQTWPEDLDYSGKRVIVIGSGATAATLVPELAKECEHVTLLQRSPTYFFPRSNEHELANQLRSLDVDESWIHEITRRQILQEQKGFIELAQNFPNEVKAALIDGVKAHLPEDFDVATHFTPKYDPWRQRIAVVPEGDIFKGVQAGKASVVTDHIDHFNEKGIVTESGQQLEADIIISATGFNLQILGGINFSVNGSAINFADTVGYRGSMFTGIPNMIWVMGYFRASWTLRVDLLGDFVCRLLKHMDEKGAHEVQVALRDQDRDMELLPWIDTNEFNPGYMLRSLEKLPKRGANPEWQHTQDYWSEKEVLPNVDLDNDLFKYR